MTTIHSEDSSDTDLAAQRSVFAADGPREPSAAANDAARHEEAKASAAGRAEVQDGDSRATNDDAMSSFDLRRFIKEHPIAAGAVAFGAIGVGVIGYRWVRHSLPVRLYLAVRFGRFRELVRM